MWRQNSPLPRLQKAARSALFAKPPKPAAGHHLSPPFVGTFVNPIFGKATVAETDAALSVTLLITGVESEIRAVGRRRFHSGSLVPEGRMAAVAANLGPSR